jgi:hypothetical protein
MQAVKSIDFIPHWQGKLTAPNELIFSLTKD